MWYKESKSVQIPDEIKRDLYGLIGKIKRLVTVLRETKSTNLSYKMFTKTYHMPYSGEEEQLEIYVCYNPEKNDQAWAYDAGEKFIIVMNAAYITNTTTAKIFEILIHEVVHFLDPKSRGENEYIDTTTEEGLYKYVTSPKEFDSISTSIVERVKLIFHSIARSKPESQQQWLDKMKQFLTMGNLHLFGYFMGSGTWFDSFVSLIEKKPTLYRRLLERLSDTVLSLQASSDLVSV